MGERIFDKKDYVKKSCVFCQYFESYCSAYYDQLEPEDMGFCKKDQHDNAVDATKTCSFFKKNIDFVNKT